MLTESARVLWRRRLAALIALLAGLCVGAAGFAAVPPTQRSTAQVLFVPSVTQPGVEGPTNPFLALGGSVAVVASLVQIGVSDDQTAEQLARQGQTAKYEVVPNLSENAGPVLIVTTEDKSAAMAQSTLRAVIGAIEQDLRQRQESQHVASNLMVGSLVLTSSLRPQVVHKKQLQVCALAMLGTWLLLVVLILLVERRKNPGLTPRRGGVEHAVNTALRRDREGASSTADPDNLEDLIQQLAPFRTPR